MKRVWMTKVSVFSFVLCRILHGGPASSGRRGFRGRPDQEFGKDCAKIQTDRTGVAEGGAAARSAVGSLCTISYGGTHSYGSWFTREFICGDRDGTVHGDTACSPSSPPPSGTYQVSKLDNDVIKALLMIRAGGIPTMIRTGSSSTRGITTLTPTRKRR